ncbi:MAG: ribonuclease R [Pirellulaceae bacterium]
MNLTDLELLLLNHVKSPEFRPVKPRIMARQLGLAEARRPEVRKAIKRLVKRGLIAYGSNHVVQAVTTAPTKSQVGIVGIFRRTAGGFGFVRPRATDTRPKGEPDIYIPANRTADAASGDLVRVRVRKAKFAGPEQRVRGEIIEVVERDTHQFVGRYRPRGDLPLVQVDGKLFAQPIPVGDPGAKNVRPDDIVVIEMVRFPSHTHDGEAVITEVLGARGKPGVDTLSIMREYGLPDAFPEDVLASAREQAESFDPERLDDRVDLRALAVITIDPVDARDFDDAISLEKTAQGQWRLGVHIADVTFFVPPKSPLDREARERATSVYLPDRVIPMLPEVISNHLASLQPQRVRFAKTVFMEFTPEGLRTHTEIVRSAIQSQQRFTYEEVQDFLDQPLPWKKKLTPPVFELLGHMHELAMVLRQRRLDNGSLELVLPEIKLELDDEGKVCGAKVVEHNASHQIIEELMLAANEAVAEHLTQRELLFLRRIHAPPSPTKLRDLTLFVRELGIPCESLEGRFEIKRVLEHVAGRPEAAAVNYAVLRSMQKAVYGPESERHYALNKTHYCHFTSPIRRYPDLTVHRLLDQLAANKRPPNELLPLMVLGEHCSEREQRAASAERELVKVKLLNYLSEQLGLQMNAIITGVEDFGLFVQGVELPAEGLVHISSLQDDYYRYDATTHSLAGHREGHRYRLGDLVKVEVMRVDVDRRELDFRILPTSGTPASGPNVPRAPKAGKTRDGARPARRTSGGRGGTRGKRNR